MLRLPLKRWVRQCGSPRSLALVLRWKLGVQRTVIHSAEEGHKALSTLARFLEAHSATLGVTEIQVSCDSIQRYADLGDNETGNVLTPDEALEKISAVLETAMRSIRRPRLGSEDYTQKQEPGVGLPR